MYLLLHEGIYYVIRSGIYFLEKHDFAVVKFYDAHRRGVLYVVMVLYGIITRVYRAVSATLLRVVCAKRSNDLVERKT